MGSVAAADLEVLGLEPEAARDLAAEANGVLARRDLTDAEDQVRAWQELQQVLLARPRWRWTFEAHRLLHRLAYEHRRPEDGPAPAWVPAPADVAASNVAAAMAEVRVPTVAAFHRWSVEHREDFWRLAIRRLGIRFREKPAAILAAGGDPTAPDWLPGARMNVAESCFSADPVKTAIVYASEAFPAVRRMTYGALRRLANRVANGLDAFGIARGERVALYLPMTPESVAAYLGIVLAGRAVVGIADASAPPEFAKRARLGGAKAVVTVESYRRDGKEHGVYENVVAADGPPAVVLPYEGEEAPALKRPQDRAWGDFLGGDAFDAVPCAPSDATNVLFSSGTTKDPKAIVWTHTTPIKGAADAWFHHDVRPGDVLAWPTSYGWMMGPWLTYASLVNRATMAVYNGAAQRRAFGEFVEEAGVTMLGVVPKLVRAWRETHAMEGLAWSGVRRFSSTAEPSDPEEMFYLMFLAGYRPIVEYCGGTEVGGGYVTGTVAQPCAPGTFTTPAMGIDFVILDDGRPADRGEAFLVPPSIGLSNELLNYDHRHEYYEGVPRGPNGEVLRRHGDQIERLPGGYYRHHGRIDDTINVNGIKTSSEEVRSAIANDEVYDAKPIAVDVDGSGQHVLVVYAVPRDLAALGSEELRSRLRREYERAIRARMSPLLAHVHDVVLVSELPQAGPGKTRTMRDLQRDYLARAGRA